MVSETPTSHEVLRRFQAVAEETRFRVVQLLARGELCVCELQAELDVAQPLLSFHLKKLKDAGLVSDRRDGRWVHYALVHEALSDMRTFLGGVTPPEGWQLSEERTEPCCD